MNRGSQPVNDSYRIHDDNRMLRLARWIIMPAAIVGTVFALACVAWALSL